MKANTNTPTAAETTSRTVRPVGVGRSANQVGRWRSTSTKITRADRVDAHLGERQVRCALQDEHQRHPVAHGAEAEHGGHAVPHDDGAGASHQEEARRGPVTGP